MCYDIPSVGGFCFFRFAFCHVLHFHIMSSCALHLHTCSSLASEHFPRCPFCNPTLICPPAPSFCLFSCAGVERSRIGSRFAKRPWFTTGRPPVMFHAIWSSFDTPTVNRVARDPSLLSAQHPSNLAQNPPNSAPCPRAFDHDRVAENRTSFGLS